MAYKELKAAFEKVTDEELKEDYRFRYWLLRLLFEINGNLDTMAVQARVQSETGLDILNSLKHLDSSYDRMAKLAEKRNGEARQR